MATFHTAQLDPFSLNGAGAISGATSITLKSFKTIGGVNLAMTDFGSVGYMTMEPGNGALEEQISFSGVVQNSNGTATLTGVKSVLFLSPYTETSGLTKTHAGSTSVVVSNTSGFYNQFPAKVNDETITGQWTFTNTPITPPSVSNASSTVKGITKLSVDPVLSTNPIAVGDNDPRVPTADPNTLYAPIAVAPTGTVLPYAGSSAPTSYLLSDGTAVSRTTYAALFAITGTTYGAGDGSTTFNLPNLCGRMVVGVGAGIKVATFASRSSNTITVTGLTNAANNEFQTGEAIVYHTSSGVITGLTNDTTYYLIRITNTSFQLATTLANAQNAVAISLSSDGSGTQTFTLTLTTRTRGDTGGEENHAMSITELLAHTHAAAQQSGTATSGANVSVVSNANVSGSTGGNAAMNVMTPFLALNYIIKT